MVRGLAASYVLALVGGTGREYVEGLSGMLSADSDTSR